MQTPRNTRKDRERVKETVRESFEAAQAGEDVEATVEYGKAVVGCETRDGVGIDARYFDVTIGHASGRSVHHEVLNSDVRSARSIVEDVVPELDLQYHGKLEKLQHATKVP